MWIKGENYVLKSEDTQSTLLVVEWHFWLVKRDLVERFQMLSHIRVLLINKDIFFRHNLALTWNIKGLSNTKE